jgi:hypothetical protein
MPGRPREVDQGLRVVMQLCHPLQNSGRHVTVDNFFTSVALAKSLRSKGLSMSGTLRKSRREISASFLQKRPHLTSLFAYMDGIQRTSYMAKPSKCVLLLPTLHNKNSIEAEDLNKPHSVVDYNRCKCPVDVLNQMAYTYSTCRKTCRWPITVFFHILDLSAINGFVTWQLKHGQNLSRAMFIKKLSLELMQQWISSRVIDQPLGALQPRIKRAHEALRLEASTHENSIGRDDETTRGRCVHCTVNRRIFSRCHVCKAHVCGEHSAQICKDCV